MDEIRLVDPRGSEWLLQAPRTARERMRGLLGRSELAASTGMLFFNCRSIHTLRMRFELDVAFLDEGLAVIDVRTVAPGRWSVRCAGAAHVLEAAAGSGLQPGDILRRP